MIVVECFEFGLAQTKILHGFAATVHAGFVDNAILTASTGHRALGITSAVTRQSFRFVISLCRSFLFWDEIMLAMFGTQL